MLKISSKITFYHKRIFPFIWFGFLLFFLLLNGYLKLTSSANHPISFFLIPILMGVFGFVLMKKLFFDLMDEVYDGGDFLLLKNGKQQEEIPLTIIRNVSYSVFANPNRITLSLREECRFGKEVSFTPKMTFNLNPFHKNPLIEDLIKRIDEKRAGLQHR